MDPVWNPGIRWTPRQGKHGSLGPNPKASPTSYLTLIVRSIGLSGFLGWLCPSHAPRNEHKRNPPNPNEPTYNHYYAPRIVFTPNRGADPGPAHPDDALRRMDRRRAGPTRDTRAGS